MVRNIRLYLSTDTAQPEGRRYAYSMSPAPLRERFMQISRRKLLQSSALLSAGVFTSASRAASRLANEQLQVGFIGVGNHAASNLVGVAKHAQVAALCDVDEKYLSLAADVYADAKTFRDLREMLESPQLDAVVISTPDHTHAWPALTAINRGLHVFCDKPLTHTSQELELLVSRAQAKKTITQTCMQHHVREGTRQAAAILQSDILGDVRAIHAWTDRPFWPQGVERPSEVETTPKTLDWDLWLGPAAERPYSSAYHPLRWRGWYDFGSGALGDFGPHLLDAIFWGLALPAPAKVTPIDMPQPAKETYPLGTTVKFEFPETNMRPGFELTWYDGRRLPAREVTIVDRPPPNGVMVIGERGKLFVPDYGGTPRLIGFKNEAKLPAPLESPDDVYQDWINACRTSGETCLPFSFTAPLMQTCLLGNIAVRTGGDLSWNAAQRKLAPGSAEKYLQGNYRERWQLPQL